MLADLAQPLLFFVTAAIGGAMNAVAGGGSFLLFPVLMLGGMSSIAANVMCTVALWPGSVASSYAYWRVMKTPVSVLRLLLLFCVIGSAIGAWILLATPEVTFKALVPWLMLIATLIFTFGRYFLKDLHADGKPSTHTLRASLGMLAIAIYGGYFGAGIGILMLALLQLIGYRQMHEMNAMKTVLGSAINAVAVIIFIASGRVVWHWALILIAGGIFGGYVGTKIALRVAPEKVRVFVVLVAISMTAYFFLHAA